MDGGGSEGALLVAVICKGQMDLQAPEWTPGQGDGPWSCWDGRRGQAGHSCPCSPLPACPWEIPPPTTDEGAWGGAASVSWSLRPRGVEGPVLAALSAQSFSCLQAETLERGLYQQALV